MVEKNFTIQSEAKVHILVADDDIEILRMLRIALLREGYQVSTAKDGAEALEKVRTDRPQILILDILMPKLDGLDLLEKIKSQKETEHLPVILLTQKKSYKDIKTGYNFGADYYITKPFKLNQIFEGIKTVLGGGTEPDLQ